MDREPGAEGGEQDRGADDGSTRVQDGSDHPDQGGAEHEGRLVGDFIDGHAESVLPKQWAEMLYDSGLHQARGAAYPYQYFDVADFSDFISVSGEH